MDLFWAFNDRWGYESDRTPDYGVWATDLNQILVRQSPNHDISVDVEEPYDENSDPPFPNIERLKVETSGDQMEIVITYVHSVELVLAILVWCFIFTSMQINGFVQVTGTQD